jgi:hypothetical protein
MKEYEFCVMHEPSYEKKRAEWRSEGGHAKQAKDKAERGEVIYDAPAERHAEAVVETEEDIPLKTPEDVEEAIRRVMKKQLTGRCSEEYANNAIKNLKTLYDVMKVNHDVQGMLQEAIKSKKRGKSA